MFLRWVVYLILLLVTLVAPTMAAAAVAVAAATDDTAESDTILVQFKTEVEPAERAALLAQLGGELVNWMPSIRVAQVRLASRQELVTGPQQLPAPEPTLSRLYQQMRALQTFSFVEFDGSVQAAFMPNDPDLGDNSKVYAPQRIEAPAAWEFGLGRAEIVIAILDTGVFTAHPEFAGRVLPGRDFVNMDREAADDNGHGTHVAGIALAGVDNGIGMAGVCGGCRLLPVKVLSHTGAGRWSQVAEGIVWAVEQGARIINLSLGGYSHSQTMLSAVAYAQSHGVLLVAAAGNDNISESFYPAAYPDVIGVTATDQRDVRWSLSNFGDYVDVAAPGHAIYSTSNDLNDPHQGYSFYSGTSMAAPHVAGLAGLLLSQDPLRTAAELRTLILGTAHDLGQPGPDATTGHGRIDAGRALSIDAPPTAVLSGTVWLDADGDGRRSAHETDPVSGITVTLHTADHQTRSTQSGADGSWRLEQLPAGRYTLLVTAIPPLYATTGNPLAGLLTHAQRAGGLDFGVSPLLPASTITDLQLSRQGDQVTVQWIVTRAEVTVITVERLTAQQGAPVVVEQVAAQVMGTHNLITVIDRLPASLADQTVYYQLRVQPTGRLFGPLRAVGSADRRSVYLPLAVIQ